MYFAEWLLKRFMRRLGSTWEWIEEYRKLILEIPGIAIVLTILGGAVWFIIASLVTISFIDTTPPTYMLYLILSVPLLFFIYNWLMALYAIYDTERMATWDNLKKPYEN